MKKLDWSKPLFTMDGREVDFMYKQEGKFCTEYVALIENMTMPQRFTEQGLWSTNKEMTHLNLTNDRKTEKK